jgi:hypothetical protein
MSRISSQRKSPSKTEFHPFPVKTQPLVSPKHAFKVKAFPIVAGFGAAPAQGRVEANVPKGFQLKATAGREGSEVKVFLTLERDAAQKRERRERLDVVFPFLPVGNYTVRYIDPRGKVAASAQYDALNPF